MGVWGDHFATGKQLFEHFMSNFNYGSVIIEEKIDGEESSFMAFCDGKHFLPLPDTRDYKRAFDDDRGPNTGGMGSYKDADGKLPFLTASEREQEVSLANKIFRGWSSKLKITQRSEVCRFTLLLCIRARALRFLRLTVAQETQK